MVKSPSGTYKREGSFIELEFRRQASYAEVVRETLRDRDFVTQVNVPAINRFEQEWTLFTPRGGKIKKHLREGEEAHEWTLQEYMTRHNLSPAQTRLGLGIVDKYKVYTPTTNPVILPMHMNCLYGFQHNYF